ncbi:MAG: hypothetical protein ACYCZB_11860 [Acidiphilium sp.]
MKRIHIGLPHKRCIAKPSYTISLMPHISDDAPRQLTVDQILEAQNRERAPKIAAKKPAE